jgi:bacterioferritin
MQAKPGVIDFLNRHLTVELTAINTYFLQSEMVKNWGYDRLGQRLRQLSMDEMKDTEELIAHILYLDGLPNVQRLNNIPVGESVLECLQADLQLEKEAVASLTEAITHCHSVGDFTTRARLEEMVQDEERHVDFFETQLGTIDQVGIQLYLAQQIHAG